MVFVICTCIGDLTRLAGLRRILHGWIWVAVANLFQIILSVSAIVAAHAVKLKGAFGELGLRAPIGRTVAFSFIAALPMLLAFAVPSSINAKMSLLSVGVGCFVAPFAEEVLFRGYMFGQLYRRARWGFWLSALIPSALFAFGHAYQASGFWELVEIFVVTGLGSLLGCWIYMRWQFNLWTVFGLHWSDESVVGAVRCGRYSARRLDCECSASSNDSSCDSSHNIQRPILEAVTSEGNAVDQTTEQSCGRGPGDRKLANSDEPFLIWQHAS